MLFKNSEEYGLPKLNHSEITCEECHALKSMRRRTLDSTNRDPGVLDVIVTDVAGPFTPFLTGEKLMVTFRDVVSTYSEIQIIRHKSEVPQRLIHVVKKWERETGRKVKIIRLDRGGEYIGGSLDKWMMDEGIQHEFSNPYEPEQNGNAERLNRTLGEMA